MDARPHRPRIFHAFGNENVPPSSKDALHQGHKPSGNIQAQARTGGLNVAAKRTAFGDVSNIAKNVVIFPEEQVAAKGKITDALGIKENATCSSKEAFTRPAQRSVVLGNRSTQAHAAAPTDAKPVVTAGRIESLGAGLSKQSATKALRILQEAQSSKEVTANSRHAEASDKAATTSHAKSSSIPQPRHHKSQPQLKKEAMTQTLRRTQSRYITKAPAQEGGWAVLDDVTEATYEDAVENLAEDDEYNRANRLSVETLEALELESAKLIDRGQTVLSGDEKVVPVASMPLSAMSDPEEYWDEEEDDELYDDQGYTTAHSHRSRGDLTAGGATTIVFPKVTSKVQKELEAAKVIVESTRSQDEIDDEIWDVCMVAEYGDEIFEYMRELEIKMLPNPHYMEIQTEIQWSMRSVLMDWLIQVHHRFSLLPETLFLTVNYIDRFLTYKIVSIGKLQLVGATALLVASKYEEINCPSLQEIVFMVDGGYSIDEIIKAERFMLSMLGFELGWPGPMSFLRRVSKADDYDLETRTLAKYFLEVTVMDERFVGSPPSFLAAGAHCLSRLILKKGDWTHAHVHYSGYTWTQLKSLVGMMLECCYAPLKHHAAVFEKYSDKRYKRAAEYVQGELKNGFRLSFQQPISNRLSYPEQAIFEDAPGHVACPKMLLPVELQG